MDCYYQLILSVQQKVSNNPKKKEVADVAVA